MKLRSKWRNQSNIKAQMEYCSNEEHNECKGGHPLDIVEKLEVRNSFMPTSDDMRQKDIQSAIQIQRIYRGYGARQLLISQKESFQWICQFDPSSKSYYYYNIESSRYQWTKPQEFRTGITDTQMESAVTIQCAFRSWKARRKVKRLRLQIGNVWTKLYDPRKKKFYYLNYDTEEWTWDAPSRIISLAPANQRVAATLRIQCAVRRCLAGRVVDELRYSKANLVDSRFVDQKLAMPKNLIDSIQMMIMEMLKTTHERDSFPNVSKLQELWSAELRVYRANLVNAFQQGNHLMIFESPRQQFEVAKSFRKFLDEICKKCVRLRHRILTNPDLIDVAIYRVKRALERLAYWKSHQIWSVDDAKIADIVYVEDVEHIIDHAESSLLELLKDGAQVHQRSSAKHEEWHRAVQEALACAIEVDRIMEKKGHLLSLCLATQREKSEVESMKREDASSRLLQTTERVPYEQSTEYADFLLACQQWWQIGLQKWEEDHHREEAHDTVQDHGKHDKGAVERVVEHLRTRSKKLRLSVWEAAREGLSVDIMRAMVVAEMKKARQHGYDFDVRSARSEHGDTLIQVACWWGHEHLVEYFLEEGSNIHSVDSVINKFSLLHDAARRGHVQVIRALLHHGLRYTLTDGYGGCDRAARRNQEQAVYALLGAFSACNNERELGEILKSVRTRNNRGRTPSQVAKSERIRRIIDAFDNGRGLPPNCSMRDALHEKHRHVAEIMWPRKFNAYDGRKNESKANKTSHLTLKKY